APTSLSFVCQRRVVAIYSLYMFLISSSKRKSGSQAWLLKNYPKIALHQPISSLHSNQKMIT
ncbi:MAG: hypothetical protein K8F91_22230, partial [Candidatus Obscuribacterales bacterium]|nr:hypothetical protein [Candidatus Obscuribacterales bacterium]